MALNIEDHRRAARRLLPHFVFGYVDGGADDEVCLARNRVLRHFPTSSLPSHYSQHLHSVFALIFHPYCVYKTAHTKLYTEFTLNALGSGTPCLCLAATLHASVAKPNWL